MWHKNIRNHTRVAVSENQSLLQPNNARKGNVDIFRSTTYVSSQKKSFPWFLSETQTDEAFHVIDMLREALQQSNSGAFKFY